MAAQITQEAFDLFLRVRDTGKTNMLLQSAVINIARLIGDREVADELADLNRQEFGELVFGQYEIIDEDTPPTTRDEDKDKDKVS